MFKQLLIMLALGALTINFMSNSSASDSEKHEATPIESCSVASNEGAATLDASETVAVNNATLQHGNRENVGQPATPKSELDLLLEQLGAAESAEVKTPATTARASVSDSEAVSLDDMLAQLSESN